MIDAVRDCAVFVHSSGDPVGPDVVERWIRSEFALFRRLAVHVVGTSSNTAPDQRLMFVLENDLTSDRAVTQEVFQLLAGTVRDAAVHLVDRIVGLYAPTSDERLDQYDAYEALEWIERTGVQNDRLRETLEAIRDVHAFETPAHPGIADWMEFGVIEDSPPLTTDEFASQVGKSPAEAVEYVLSFEDRLSHTGRPTRDDALAMVRETVTQQASVGLALWPHLSRHSELQATVIGAWGTATEPADLEAILSTLLGADLRSHDHAMGQFLTNAVRAPNSRWEDAPNVDAYIRTMWEACATEDEFNHEGDWVTKVINMPVGVLLDFWFHVFRRRWVAAGDEWTGISADDKMFLQHALDDRTKRGAAGVTQIAGRLHLLDAADPDWCRRTLLPLSDWTDQRVAVAFWSGFLSFGRWTSGLAAAGLLRGLIDTGQHLQEFDDDECRRWASFLASIAVRCETPAASEWVPDFVTHISEPRRVNWLSDLRDELSDLDEAGRAATWSAWLADHWQARIDSKPFMLTRAEADAFAHLAPFAPIDRLSQVVDLVAQTDAGFDSDAQIAEDTPDELLATQPDTFARLFTHLMRNTATPFYGSYILKPKLIRLVQNPGDWNPLREAALRLDIDLGS